ncbi:MAG: DUF2382 domain-containing protein [Nostocales cyanobacterium]|nr:MAG: DUF2382 domain-containing protein [Nostocales cyanobacterium]
MPLYKLEEFDPSYRETFGGDDIKSLNLYTEGGTEVGAVADALVDENGRFRYLVIDTRLDAVGKKILLPIGLARINYSAGCVYVDGLSKQQVEHLPEYRENIIVDHEFEENVRKVYRSTSGNITYDRENYTYEQEPSLYGLNKPDHQTFRLYEERLIANKHRVKTGEVSVSKHIETQTARVTVPIERERVVIDRVQSPDIDIRVDPNEIKFQEGEVARIDVYQETPEIHKEAFVREEVRVRKVVERDIVEAEDLIRREELDIDNSGLGDLNVKENSLEIHHDSV